MVYSVTNIGDDMKMKGAVLYQTGKSLVVENDIDVPALQVGQVLVKVAYSGVCRSQLMEVRGKRGEDRYLPHLLGHEGSGIVVDVGREVSKVKPGDKVVLTWIKGEGINCQGAKYKKGDLIINSGSVTTFNEYTVISENRCVKLPDGVPMDIASLFGCAVLTGAGIVTNTIHPKQSDSIAIFGVGGIGLSALMATQLYNCSEVIAVDVEESKLNLAKDFGATHIIDSAVEDPVEKIFKITGGKGVDFAIEAAGLVRTIEQAFASVRNESGLCVFASHPPHGEKIKLDPFDLICGKQISGSWGGGSEPDNDIPRFVQLYKEGKLPLEKMITHRYSLEQINQIFDDIENNRVARALIEFD